MCCFHDWISESVKKIVFNVPKLENDLYHRPNAEFPKFLFRFHYCVFVIVQLRNWHFYHHCFFFFFFFFFLVSNQLGWLTGLEEECPWRNKRNKTEKDKSKSWGRLEKFHNWTTTRRKQRKSTVEGNQPNFSWEKERKKERKKESQKRPKSKASHAATGEFFLGTAAYLICTRC